MHDWNRPEPESAVEARAPEIVDETLRDGLQSPSVRDPSIERKIALLHAMASIGVDIASVGLPAAGKRAADNAVELVREIHRAKLALRPTAAARTTDSDVEAIAEVSQRAGAPIEVYAFIGSSPIRHFVESWDLEFLLTRIRSAADTARRAGLPFCLVTEDTSRANPLVLTPLFKAAIDGGAGRLCLCDTVGHAEPRGVEALVSFVRDLLASIGAGHVGTDWHGHNDRGLGVANALWAARCGVQRIHGTALGVGERVGNVPTEQLVHNMSRLGYRDEVPLAKLRAYSDLAAIALEREIPAFEPLVGTFSRRLDAERSAHCPRDPLLSSTVVISKETAVGKPVENRDALRTMSFEVNGDVIELATRPSRTLLEVLRYDLDLVGSKQGCDKGDCGACTVLIDGEPVLSCLTLALNCENHRVTTVESLPGPPALDPLLDAFDRCGAGQCGFCTPGMLMTATALLRTDPRPSRDLIRNAISGNLCRCTGYGAIVTAIELAAKIRNGEEPSCVDLPGSALVPPALPRHKDKEPGADKERAT